MKRCIGAGARTGKFATRGIVPLRDEPVVGYYINGTPLLFDYRPSLLSEISEIRVLKGPQLHYGVSPLGGIIDIKTKVLSDNYLISLSAGFANYNTQEYVLETSLPFIKDKLQLNLSGYWEMSDGYFTNFTLGLKNSGGLSEGGFRGDMIYRQRGHSTTLSTYYKNSEESHLPFAGNLDRGDEFPYGLEHNVDNLRAETVLGVSLTYQYQFRAAMLNSILSFKQLDSEEVIDTDFGTLNTPDLKLNTDDNSYYFDGEVNIKSMEAEEGFTWGSGLYVNVGQEDLSNNFDYGAGAESIPEANIAAGDFDSATGESEKQNISLWGYGSFTSKPFFFGLEGRLDYHKRGLNSTRIERRSGGDTNSEDTNKMFIFDEEKEYFFFSPKGSIAYQKPFITLFFNIAYISKPGDYNFLVSDENDLEYQLERLTHYELGAKIFPSRQFYFGLTGFMIDWEDIHIYTFRRPNAYEFSTINGGRARSQGIEVESSFRSKGFLIEGNLGYTRAQFLDGASKNIIDPFATADTGGTTSFADNEIPFTPNVTGFTAIQYKKRFGGKKFWVTPYARVEYAYKGGHYFSELNKNKSDPLNLLGAKLGVNLNDYEVVAYIDNILNEQTYVYILEVSGFQKILFAPSPLDMASLSPKHLGYEDERIFCENL